MANGKDDSYGLKGNNSEQITRLPWRDALKIQNILKEFVYNDATNTMEVGGNLEVDGNIQVNGNTFNLGNIIYNITGEDSRVMIDDNADFENDIYANGPVYINDRLEGSSETKGQYTWKFIRLPDDNVIAYIDDPSNSYIGIGRDDGGQFEGLVTRSDNAVGFLLFNYGANSPSVDFEELSRAKFSLSGTTLTITD